MEKQLARYFVGAVGFALVVTWATLGATTAVLATIVCLAATKLDRLRRPIHRKQLRSGNDSRPSSSKLTTRPLNAESAYDLIPDEPSLIINVG